MRESIEELERIKRAGLSESIKEEDEEEEEKCSIPYRSSFAGTEDSKGEDLMPEPEPLSKTISTKVERGEPLETMARLYATPAAESSSTKGASTNANSAAASLSTTGIAVSSAGSGLPVIEENKELPISAITELPVMTITTTKIRRPKTKRVKKGHAEHVRESGAQTDKSITLY